MTNKTFGEILKIIRTNANLSQDEVAKKFGVSRSTIGKWEQDLAKPDYEKLIKLSEYFGVNLEQLVGREPIGEHAELEAAKQVYPEQIAYIEKFRDEMVRRGYESFGEKSAFELAEMLTNFLKASELIKKATK